MTECKHERVAFGRWLGDWKREARCLECGAEAVMRLVSALEPSDYREDSLDEHTGRKMREPDPEKVVLGWQEDEL